MRLLCTQLPRLVVTSAAHRALPDFLDFEEAVGLPPTKFWKVVLQRSIPKQIRQIIFYVSNSEEYVDRFVGDLTSAKRFLKQLV